MADKKFIDDISFNTILGSGSVVAGDVTVSGFLRVDGDIRGNLKTDGRLIIGKDARIQGDICASSISVGGTVQGDIVAPEGVVVLSSGMVIGSIFTKKLRIDDNVILHGFCSAINDQAHFDEVEKKYHDQRALYSSSLSSVQ